MSDSDIDFSLDVVFELSIDDIAEAYREILEERKKKEEKESKTIEHEVKTIQAR